MGRPPAGIILLFLVFAGAAPALAVMRAGNVPPNLHGFAPDLAEVMDRMNLVQTNIMADTVEAHLRRGDHTNVTALDVSHGNRTSAVRPRARAARKVARTLFGNFRNHSFRWPKFLTDTYDDVHEYFTQEKKAAAEKAAKHKKMLEDRNAYLRDKISKDDRVVDLQARAAWKKTIEEVLDGNKIDVRTSDTFQIHMEKIAGAFNSQCRPRFRTPIRIGKCNEFVFKQPDTWEINYDECRKLNGDKAMSTRKAVMCELGDITEDFCMDADVLAKQTFDEAKATEDKDGLIPVLFSAMIEICTADPGCKSARQREIENRVDVAAAGLRDVFNPLKKHAWWREMLESAKGKLESNGATDGGTSLYDVPIRAVDVEARAWEEDDTCATDALERFGSAHQSGKFVLKSGLLEYMEGELMTKLKAWYNKHFGSFCDLLPMKELSKWEKEKYSERCKEQEEVTTWVFDTYPGDWKRRGAKVVEFVLKGDIPTAEDIKPLKEAFAKEWLDMKR